MENKNNAVSTGSTENMHKKKVALELLASHPEMSDTQIAEHLGLSKQVVCNWLRDPNFIDAFYKRYMEVAGSQLPVVVSAVIREASMGNVQAARLVLEHFGKLDNRIKIQVESPFEKFMKMENIEDAEIIDNDELSRGAIDISSQASSILSGLPAPPDRDASNNTPRKRERVERERVVLATEAERKLETKRMKERLYYQRRQRAKNVGLDLMPPGRFKNSERLEWWDKLESLEIEKFGEVKGERS